MSDRNNERFSALVDGELDNFDQDLEQLSNDDELQQRWRRYHLIRDVISGHATEKPSINLAEKVSQALEHEPTVLAPQRKVPQQLFKQAAGLAIAAAVSTIAIISIQNTPIDETSVVPLASVLPNKAGAESKLANIPLQPSQNVLLSSTNSKPASKPQLIVSNPSITLTTASQTAEPKLSRYLVNHNEYSTITQMQGMLSYMRIVGKAPNKPIAIQVTNEK
ncbi:MAG: sigma-E factor negative regulatory protein [Gammaproteobacteria bacterium]|nr:sigma-E factor negative regulatory protein [Gammaproteobacteria bacterium]